ncbi:MAG: hypothetical protein U1F43_24245 [Myxococcota bacterium]
MLPFWADALAELVESRGDASQLEHARERLERARLALASEKKEAVLWRWQPRLAEAKARIARPRAPGPTRARHVRGLDQLAQTRSAASSARLTRARPTSSSCALRLSLARLSPGVDLGQDARAVHPGARPARSTSASAARQARIEVRPCS